jgi:galactonate dehydratase
VYELVGGPVCDAVRAFASIGDADEARDRLALGFTAFTLRLSSSDTGPALLPLVEAVRARIGPGSDLAIDCGGQLSLASARQLLPLLEPYRLLVLSEPVRGAPPQVLADLARRSSVPLSAGRRVYSRWDLQPLLATGLVGVDVDVAAAGGISETRRVAALAETHQIRVSLASNHGPLALAAALQVGFSTANIVGLAWRAAGFGAHADYASSPFGQVEAGCYKRLDGPGLGVAIDEAAITRAAARQPH